MLEVMHTCDECTPATVTLYKICLRVSNVDRAEFHPLYVFYELTMLSIAQVQ